MDYFSLAGIAIGLSMDAVAVCVTNGAVTNRITKSFALRLAVTFGLFQGGMPMLGWLIGKAGETFISSVDHWVALILLCFLGAQMLLEVVKKRRQGCVCLMREPIGLRVTLVLAVATSIDALAMGILLPTAVGASTLPLMGLSALLICLVTTVLSLAGVSLGKRFGTVCSGKAEMLGGGVLILIGVKIFVEHMFFS